MKKILLIAIVLNSFPAMSQDSTVVLNLQLKAGTIKTLCVAARSYTPDNFFRAYVKWYNSFKANNHANNANVTVDTIPTIMIASLYDLSLFDVRYSDIITDMQTSLTSKRSSNAYLNRLCTASEARLAQLKLALLTEGEKILFGSNTQLLSLRQGTIQPDKNKHISNHTR